MASEIELRHHPTLLRGAAKANTGRLALAPIQPQATAADVQRTDASSLASVVAGPELWTSAETTSAGAV
jgi:hypothetical protein